MNPTNVLRFSLSDLIDGADIGPARVPLALLGQFQSEVSDFLKGLSGDVDPCQVQVAIEEGSLALVASGLLAAASLWHDLEQLKQSESLDDIDPKRAAIVERWQTVARQSPHRGYTVGEAQQEPLLLVNASNNFRRVGEGALALAFADYEPVYDESAFNRMVERGTIAWADVPDISQWIENLRGSTDQA